ncbi:MarR family transcriptional regulator [Erythrobacter sp. GH1-10]|uniref:MarR family transcriptional regulator n=1 Tax=Erythrobacter sp. GH1-10 TaxID=3349334 RepID=UPI0038780390
MTQADYTVEDFAYEGPRDAAGLPVRVAIFADRASTRAQIHQDLAGAGFRGLDGGEIAVLLDGPIAVLGDVVMVDCPVIDAQRMAALMRLDMRVARSDARLIVATSIEALDEVFAAFDQSQPEILVEPSRAERVVAVGRVLADIGKARVREMTEEDRLALLRLSQQVDAIAQELDRISEGKDSTRQRLSEFKQEWHAADPSVSKLAKPNSGTAALPDPRMVRRMIRARQARAKFFDAELFADPAWDMLLDLTAAHAEHKRVSVTSLCIASGVPATTALRWIKQLVASGVFERIADASDGRRAFIALSERSLHAMARYFAEVETPLMRAA